MINKLKRRFIILAMISLAVLLSVIVAGMNMINYSKVVSDADIKLAVLEESSGRIMLEDRLNPFGDFEEYFFNDEGFLPDHRGPGKHSMSRDEAEESRFFMVSVDESGSVLQTYTDRISAVDGDDAAVYAAKALASGNGSGFVGDFRYAVSDSDNGSTLVFLDCGRTLDSFRSFLRASIIMSLAGLIAVFFVMLYFAGRIVRPVAESYEKQKRFITDAGHEIKTPLAIIKANVDLMDMEIDNGVSGITEGLSISDNAADNLRENLGDINDQVTRLTGLTNDLVYLSRMEEAENSLVLTEVPLSDIVSETVESFEPLALEKCKVIDADVAPGIAIKGSHKELEKLLSILLENAIKYSPSPRAMELKEDEDGMPALPVIETVLRKEGKNAVLEVINGTENELTNEQLTHVFERFYRTDSSRNSATGGHGIGLSMANAIVNAHGGKITAHTKTGHDFMITVTLPAI